MPTQPPSDESTSLLPSLKSLNYDQPQEPPPTCWFLYMSIGIVNLVPFTTGLGVGCTPTLLAKLSLGEGDNPLERVATPGEISWIASLHCLGCICAPPVMGYIPDKVGRKMSLILTVIPLGVSLLIAVFAKTVALFYLSRLLLGLGLGSVFVILPIYLNEISQQHNRGAVNCTMNISLQSGITFGLILGSYLSIQAFSILALLPILLFLLLFPGLVPESPQYLAASRNLERLKESLMKLRQDNTHLVLEEMSFLVATEGSQKHGCFRDLLATKANLLAFVLVVCLLGFQQLSGISAIYAYLQLILKSTSSGTSLDSYVIFIGIGQLVANFAAASLVERLGRRLLLVISSMGMGFGLVSLSVFFFLEAQDLDNIGNVKWLSLVSVMVYMCAFYVGLGPIPWVILSECFPPNLKIFVASIGSGIVFLVAFFVTLFFSPLLSMVGLVGTLCALAVVSFSCLVFVCVMVPETKNRTLEEIQEMLVNR